MKNTEWLVDVTNNLTDEQKQEASDKLETLMGKYMRLADRDDEYFTGVADGLNHAFKLINEINDDYNSRD